MNLRPSTLSSSRENPKTILSTDKSKEFASGRRSCRQRMKCGCAANLAGKSRCCCCCRWRELYNRKSSHRGRTATFCGKGGQLILAATSGSHHFHPPVPAAAEKQQALCSRSLYSVSCSSGHGKNETLSFGITEFRLSCSSVAWPVLEVQPECGPSLCACSCLCNLASVISKVKNKQIWYLTRTIPQFGITLVTPPCSKSTMLCIHTELCLGTANMLLWNQTIWIFLSTKVKLTTLKHQWPA